MRMRYVSWVLPVTVLVAANATGEPHVHGKGRLALAPDPNGVQLELVVAAADVWGFEHEPRTEEEAARRAAALEALEGSLPGILQFPPDLGCVHDSSTVTTEVPEGQEADQTDRHAKEEHEHEEEHEHKEEHGHKEKHEHEEEHEHKEEHEHGEGREDAGGHSEVRATAKWSCRRSPLGHDVEVRRPPEVPGLSALEVWVLGASGQSSTLLRRPSAAVRLK